MSSKVRYQAVFSPAAQHFLATCARDIRQQVGYAVHQLQVNPRCDGAKELANQGQYRYRVGDYRIIYEIRDKVLLISVVNIGHRREIYR